MKISNKYLGTLWFICVLSCPAVARASNKVIIYPAPPSEILNRSYRLYVNGKSVPVYNAKIGAKDDVRRFKAVDNLLNSADYFDIAAFGYFDLAGKATVKVSTINKINTVKILPSSAAVKYTIQDNMISFSVYKPENLTVEINGETVKSLHVFVNPVDDDIPNAADPNVIFFGPGIHEINNLVIKDNQTIYIAGGGIVRAAIGKNEKFGVEPSGLRNYDPRILLLGNHIRLCGHGIIDAGECPTHAGNFIVARGNDIAIEGIIIRNSCGWTVPIRQSHHLLLDNIKILGYRANSDGIDICNSTDVQVKNCFVRTNDDLIVIKTESGEGVANHILVENCVLWNAVSHALSLGSELREDVSDVIFRNCDIIHDVGREWSLRVFQGDSSTVSNVKFENIRIEESHRLISLWIDKNISSINSKLGRIHEVTFKNIYAAGYPLSIEMHGGDQGHKISNTVFNGVFLNNKGIKTDNIEKNQFYEHLTILP